jgi:hypothetical protein
MFDAIPISMAFVSEIEAVTRAYVLERCRSINEKHGVIDVVFLAEFSEERVSETLVITGSSFVWRIRLTQDRQQRTANIVRHRAGSRSHRPPRDLDFAPSSAVALPCEPSYERLNALLNTEYRKNRNCIQK